MQDDRLRTSLPHAVVRLFRHVNRVHNRLLKAAGVTAEQAHVLMLLDALGPMTIGELQRLLALSSPTLTGAIDRLEAQDLVRRTPSPDDRRAFRVEALLTSRQRAKIDAATAAADDTCFGMLDERERAQLLKLIDRCVSHIESTNA